MVAAIDKLYLLCYTIGYISLYVHMCIYIYIYMFVHTYICIYIYGCIYICVHVHPDIHIYIYMYVCVYILFCAKCPNAVHAGKTFNRFRFRLSNHKHSIKHNFSGYPIAMHFNEQSHTIKDLRCIIIRNHVPNMDNNKLIEQKNHIKLNTHITGLNKDRDFYRIMTFKLSALVY